MVLCALADSCGVSPENLDKSAEIWCERWVRDMLNRRTGIGCLGQILSAGKKFDSRIKARAVRAAFRNPVEGLNEKVWFVKWRGMHRGRATSGTLLLRTFRGAANPACGAQTLDLRLSDFSRGLAGLRTHKPEGSPRTHAPRNP